MTTNSFGTALPPFDFPKPEAPVVSRYARVAKLFPLAAVAATGIAAWYYTYAPSQKTPASTVTYLTASAVHRNQAAQSQSPRQGVEREYGSQPKSEGALKPSG